MPVRGVGPGPGPGRRARATFRRRGQRRQSTTAPKHTGRAAPRAWVVGSSSSAESCPWRTEPERTRAPPPPAPAPEPGLLSALCGQETRAQRGQAACPRGHSGSAEAPALGAALHPALPAQRGVRTAAVPTCYPARRTATVSSTRERPFGLLLREIFTRERMGRNRTPFLPRNEPPEGQGRSVRAGRGARELRAKRPVCARSSQLTRLHLLL